MIKRWMKIHVRRQILYWIWLNIQTGFRIESSKSRLENITEDYFQSVRWSVPIHTQP